MAESDAAPNDLPPYKGPQAPCVYCGRIIERGVDRCPHCRTSYSFAVRKASREVVGDWFYLDPRNPSGRGVTFETLVKMVEKGRIRPDSVVRGPTTHYDWMYAAETPRLAKYLGLCPHCFAPAKPEETYCSNCHLNMNERPADARPGTPPEEIKDPYHKAAYEMEERLAEALKSVPAASAGKAAAPAGKAAAPGGVRPAAYRTPPPRPVSSTAAAAAAAVAEAAPDRPSRIVALARRRGPKLWVVLLLTWATLIPAVVLAYLFIPGLREAIHGSGGGGGTAGTSTSPAGPSPAGGQKPDPAWLQRKLAEADAAEQRKDYQAAIAIYEEIIAKTGDQTYRTRVQALKARPEEERKRRLAKLKERIDTAEKLSAEGRYDDALAVLRNIPKADRAFLAEMGVGVEAMETSIQQARQRRLQAEKQKQELARRLAEAARLRQEKKLKEALAAYTAIGNDFPESLVAGQVDLAAVVKALQEEIAAQAPPKPPEPEPAPEKAAREIADLLAQAAALEKEEKFAEALAVLEKIRSDYDRKFWPERLEERIRQVKAKKEALEFFGLDK